MIKKIVELMKALFHLFFGQNQNVIENSNQEVIEEENPSETEQNEAVDQEESPVEEPIMEEANEGYEWSMPIMETIRVTGSNQSISHKGTKATDLGGAIGEKGKVYMPFTAEILLIHTESNSVVARSIDKVKIPLKDREGQYRKEVVCFRIAHDSSINSNVKVGAVIQQGEYFYDEGLKNTTQEHVHIIFGLGEPTLDSNNTFGKVNSYGNYGLICSGGAIEIYEAMFLSKDTVLLKNDNPADAYPWIVREE